MHALRRGSKNELVMLRLVSQRGRERSQRDRALAIAATMLGGIIVARATADLNLIDVRRYHKVVQRTLLEAGDDLCTLHHKKSA